MSSGLLGQPRCFFDLSSKEKMTLDEQKSSLKGDFICGSSPKIPLKPRF